MLMISKTGKPKAIGLEDIEKEVKRLQGRATTLQSKVIVRTDANVERTGSMVDIQRNGIGLRRLERDLSDLGSQLLIGRCGELLGYRILDWEEKLADQIIKITRPINSTTMDQWAEKEMDPKMARDLIPWGVHKWIYHIEERYADSPHQQIVSMDYVNSTITVHLSYFRKGKFPLIMIIPRSLTFLSVEVEKLKREHALANSIATRKPMSGRQTLIRSKL